jgi:TonB family protein
MLKQIGKFTISERIGRGTHCRVYRAVDSHGRAVAIKVSTTQAEPEHLNEFQKDLVAAASVLHPNLVAVHDLGFEDDFPYLVMELVEGRDLDKLLKTGGTVSLPERIRVMQQVGDALKSSHERGVYHLDIRPSKIMLGDDGSARLLDLGLGRLSFDPARVTDRGYLVGAPFYMSPERLTAIETANAKCDIWSFGVTFYEWISGHHPFYDDDGERMIGNIMDAQPESLAGVPASLNKVILRSLEKDPSDRYATFAELLGDMRPMMTDLKREESDALMAEALKQTDSGRWHEARRIARKLREMDPQQAREGPMFGHSDPEQGNERVVPPPPPAGSRSPAASVADSVVAAVVSAVPVIETPEPTLPPAPVAPPLPLPITRRPERTAPKLPAMGSGAAGRNGSTVIENPPAAARSRQERVTNGGRMAATAVDAAAAQPIAAEAANTVARETRFTTPPLAGSERPRPVRSESPFRPAASSRPVAPSGQRPAQPAPTVRILELSESSGVPWGKIGAFAVPVLLIAGLVFFLFRSDPKILNAAGSSNDAKQLSRAERVIKVSNSSAPDSATTPANNDSQVTTSAPIIPGSNDTPDLATATTDANGVPIPPKPRTFDPKSLIMPKAVPPPRRLKGSLAALAPPSLSSSGLVPESNSLPVALSAPPPPPPVVKAPVSSPATTPEVAVPVATPAPQTTQATQAAAGKVGGAFAQPVLIQAVQPIYPPAAYQRKTQGVVRFQATVTKNGSLKNLQLVSGDPLLTVAAKQAVLQWKYRPAMLNGEPVEVTQAIVVKFNLNQ